jgi:hypothetical protein
MTAPISQVVSVTKDNISNGLTCDSASCPIALALLEKYNECLPLVDTHEISVRLNNKVYVAKTPKEAIEFIDNFDVGNPVEPFSITLEFVQQEKNTDSSHLRAL